MSCTMQTATWRVIAMSCRHAIWAAALALLVAGCAGRVIDTEMQYMIGRPASEVFLRLGIPDDEGRVAGLKYYVWKTQSTGTHVVPQHNTGTIHGADGTSTIRYTTLHHQIYNLECTFRVFVDPNERVTTWDFKGTDGGCPQIAQRLLR